VLFARAQLFARVLLVICTLPIALHASVARAAVCGSESRPWLAVEFTWHGAVEGLEQAVLSDLRAGFAPRGIDVCARMDGPSAPPVAVARLGNDVEDPALVEVEVFDTVTQKSVSRDMNLSRVPQDGQAFAVALGTDERAQHRSKRPPPEVARGLRDDLPRQEPETLRVALLARGAFEHFSGGQAYWGGDAGVAWSLASHFELRLALGVREGLQVSTNDGDITSSALGGDAAAELLFWRSDALRAGVLLGARMARLRLQGSPNPNVDAAVLERMIVVGRAGLALDVHLTGPLWLGLGAGAGLPARGLEATDSGAVVTAATGLEVSSQLGLGVTL
jgi:hypothetical protein